MLKTGIRNTNRTSWQTYRTQTNCTKKSAYHGTIKTMTHPDNLIAEDITSHIPCEAFWLNQWYEATIIRQIQLKTGIGGQCCRIYLVEFADSRIRQWLSASLVRQPTATRLEPEDY